MPADPGMQTQEFLSAFPPSKSLLRPLLSACGSVFLCANVVAPGCGDHLLVVDVDQTGDLSNRGSAAAELVGMDDLWTSGTSYFPSSRVRKVFAASVSRCRWRKMSSTKSYSSTALQSQRRTPSTHVHTSSICHREPRRGSRWRRSSAKRGPNFMHHSRRVS